MTTIPPSLNPGDTIGIVCPAGYMDAGKLAECIRVLTEEWGYKVRLGATVGGSSTTYFSGTDDERLNDLQAMLDDREIKAVLCGRGGYGTGRIIDRINFRKFRKHPKWIIGFSDITILHTHIYGRFGISTLHAPMGAAFNDAGYVSRYVQSLKGAIQGRKARYECEAHELNRTGIAAGEVIGGNLALLAHVIGTRSDFSTKGKILFIEDVGEYIYSVDRMMHQLKRSGKLDKLAGLLVGGFTDMKDTERPFGAEVYSLIADLVAEYDYPVSFNFPVSHGKENYALKIGALYDLKVMKDRVLLSE